MTRTVTIALLLAALVSTSLLGACTTTQPNALAGRNTPSTNINARFPTLPPQ